MASPATAAFLARWRRTQDVDRRVLVKVALTDPTTLTLYLATETLVTPDGQRWDGLLTSVDAIEAPGEFLAEQLGPASMSFTVAAQRAPWQTAGTMLTTLYGWRWVGATVTVYLWESGLTSFSDALQAFSGPIENYQASVTGFEVYCTQSTAGNQTMIPNRVTRAKYPRCPEAEIGRPIPLVFGDGSPLRMRGDWDGEVGLGDSEDGWTPRALHRQRFDICSGMIPSSKCVIADDGRDPTTKGRVLVASHTLKSVIDDGGLSTLGINTNSSCPALADFDFSYLINEATEAGFYVPSTDTTGLYGYVYVPLGAPMTDVDLGGDPQKMLVTRNEYGYSKLDWNSTKLKITLTPTNAPAALGIIMHDVPGYIVIGYKTKTAGDCGQHVTFKNTTVSANDVQTWRYGVGLPSSTTPTTAKLQLHPATDTVTTTRSMNLTEAGNWDFSKMSMALTFYTGTWANCWWHVYFCGLVIRYRPNRELLSRKTFTVSNRVPYPWSWYRNVEARFGKLQFAQETFGISSGFYAQPRGYPDEGGGTYTGSASALIERAPDLAHFILDYFGGLGSGDVVTAASTFGSFVDARALLKTWANADMRYFRAVDDDTTVHDALRDLAEQSTSAFLIDRFTNKYHWIVWAPGAAANYDYVVRPEDTLTTGWMDVSFESRTTPVRGLSVKYLYDAATSGLIGETACGTDHSQSGYGFLDLRDENLTVVADASDRLDFYLDATSYTASLTPGAYTPTALMQHVATQMAAVAIAKGCHVDWGATVVAAYNDRIDINDGSVKVATMNAGDYVTMEALATEVARALNAASSGWTCAFDRATNKFTIGHAGGSVSLLWASGANKVRSAQNLLGYYYTDASGTSFLAGYTREEERFAIGRHGGTLDILWESGTHGVNGTRRNCAELLGFLNLCDATGGQSSFRGLCPKNNRELTLAATATRYGPLAPRTKNATWVRDSYTARELRNRLIRLQSDAKVVVRFESTSVVDMQRGRVISFSSAWDSWIPYPKPGSNGSWAGKTFYVVDVRQFCGPDRWHTEVTAVEVPA